MTTRPGGLHSQRRASSRAPDAPEALVGRVLDGRYRLEEVLSAGGMGIVYRGVQLSMDRAVAVKVLRPALATELDLMRRFSLEVDVSAQLAHPHIIPVIDAGRDPTGLVYLVMEHFDGMTFREALQGKELTLVEILEVFLQTCDALLEAHEQGVIHRDLKFDNIMLRRQRDGRLHVKVLDFGVAKMLGVDHDLTRNGQIPGTPGIIAPELVDMKRPSSRSDIYSLGVLLYTALAGKAPFSGHNDLELMRAHRYDEVPRLEGHVQAYVPDQLVELVYVMMSKDPDARPQDVVELRARLEALQRTCKTNLLEVESYVPPSLEAPGSRMTRAFSLSAPDARAEDRSFDDRLVFDPEEAANALEARDREGTLLVPASVVAMLSFILLVLVLVIIVLVFQLIRAGA
jgi:serine/threonine-protein kinase